MRFSLLKTSANILFCLLWFGVFRQDTFAQLIADTKNANAAPETNVIDFNDILYEEPGHLSDLKTPHAIVETIVRQTMYLPLKSSNPSSHIKDIFLGSSFEKRDAEFAPMIKPAEIWNQEAIAQPAAILESHLSVTPSPYLSFKDFLESIQPSEINSDAYLPFSEPIIILTPEDLKSYAHVNDVKQPDSIPSNFWETDDDGYFLPYSPKSSKSPQSQRSYKDLLLGSTLKNQKKPGSSISEESDKIFPSYVSSFDAFPDSDKLAVNSKVDTSFSDDTTPREGSKSPQPSTLEKFLKSILPIFLSPASFDITFPGNETESNPLTETTKNVGFNSK